MFSELFQELSCFPEKERVANVCWPTGQEPCPFLEKVNGSYHCLRNSQKRTRIEKKNGNGHLKPRCKGILDVLLSKKESLCNTGVVYKVAYPDFKKEGFIQKIKIKKTGKTEILLIFLKLFPDYEKNVIGFNLNSLVIDIFDDAIILEPLEYGICLGRAEISQSRADILKDLIRNIKGGRS